VAWPHFTGNGANVWRYPAWPSPGDRNEPGIPTLRDRNPTPWGWNKRSGSTNPPDVLLCGGSAALDPPYGTAAKHHVGWNKQSGSTDHPRRSVLRWVRCAWPTLRDRNQTPR